MERYCQRLIKAHTVPGGRERKWESRPYGGDVLCGKPAHFQLGEERARRLGHTVCIGYWVCAEHYNEYYEGKDSDWERGVFEVWE